MTAKLSDLQRLLLSSAAARQSGNLMPLPDSLASKLSQVGKSASALLKRDLVAKVAGVDPGERWRQYGDRHIGIFINDAGRAAVGAKAAEASEQPTATAKPARTARPTKSAQVVALLRREQGATLAELVKATGWLPHTTRAALTGLRKKGHSIAKGKRGDITCYTLGGAA